MALYFEIISRGGIKYQPRTVTSFRNILLNDCLDTPYDCIYDFSFTTWPIYNLRYTYDLKVMWSVNWRPEPEPKAFKVSLLLLLKLTNPVQLMDSYSCSFY